MRWEQLTEDSYDVDEIVEYIRSNCQPYLTQNPKLFPLYRGVKNQEDIFIKDIRTDRQPKDTEPLMHKLVDDYLKKAGFVATRSNSIFCTGSKKVEEYGEIYVIFPVGDFNFTWNPTIRDLTIVMDSTTMGFFKLKYDDPRTFEYDKLPNRARQYIEMIRDTEELEPIKPEFKTADLEPYFSKRLMNRVTALYFMELGAVTFSDPAQHQMWSYSTSDLEKAIRSHCEIMISGSKYVGIDFTLFEKVRNKLL